MDSYAFRTLVVMGAIALGGAYVENRRQARKRREEAVDESLKNLAGIVCEVGTEADRRLDHLGRHVTELLEERDARERVAAATERTCPAAHADVAGPTGFVVDPARMTEDDFLELGRTAHAAAALRHSGVAPWDEMGAAERGDWALAARAVLEHLRSKAA